jgi:ABC-type polysaccharide/polyol phosphate export permease
MLPWLFMLAVAISFTALQLVFKRTGGLAGAVHGVLGIASGLNFPPQAIPLVGEALSKLPTAVGLRAFRELMVFGESPSLQPTLSRILTPLTAEWSLVFVTAAFLAASFILLAKVEEVTRRWGTIEQY